MTDSKVGQKEYQRLEYEREHGYLKPVDSRYVTHLVTTLLDVGRIEKNTPVLEVGCGMGRFTFKLLKLGFPVVGLDMSRSMLERLKDYLEPGESFEPVCADVDHIGKEYPEKYRQIIGFFILHHVPDLETTFRSVFRSLRPGGKIAFLEPNPWNPLYYLRFLFWRDQTWEGEKGYLNMTRRKMYGAMEHAGFVKIKRERLGFFPPFVTNTAWGYFLEKRLEKIRWLNGVLPFQIFTAEKY